MNRKEVWDMQSEVSEASRLFQSRGQSWAVEAQAVAVEVGVQSSADKLGYLRGRKKGKVSKCSSTTFCLSQQHEQRERRMMISSFQKQNLFLCPPDYRWTGFVFLLIYEAIIGIIVNSFSILID